MTLSGLSKLIGCIRNVRIRSFFNVYLHNALFGFLFVMLNKKKQKKLDPLSRLFTIKVVLISLFTSFNFHSCFKPIKASTENQLHDFLINSRHSHENYCLHNCTLWGITVTIDPLIKFGLRVGDCFVKKLSFSCVFLRWSSRFWQ